MTTFDVTGGTAAEHDRETFGGEPISTLDLLREVGDQQVEFPPFVFENPLHLVRFTCRTDVSSREYQGWQRAALPATRGRVTGTPDVTKMDQFRLYARAIADTCEQVEIRRDVNQEYRTVTDSRGNLLTFSDTAFLSSLGTPDKLLAVRKLMGNSDPAVLDRGAELLVAAGYGGEDGDEDDPR